MRTSPASPSVIIEAIKQCIDCQIQMSVETSVSRKEEGPHPSEAPYRGQQLGKTWCNSTAF